MRNIRSTAAVFGTHDFDRGAETISPFGCTQQRRVVVRNSRLLFVYASGRRRATEHKRYNYSGVAGLRGSRYGGARESEENRHGDAGCTRVSADATSKSVLFIIRVL